MPFTLWRPIDAIITEGKRQNFASYRRRDKFFIFSRNTYDSTLFYHLEFVIKNPSYWVFKLALVSKRKLDVLTAKKSH